MFVTSEAYLSEQTWLEVGWSLWAQVSPERDYFLCLPTKDWQGARPLEAKYTDALAMGRCLLTKLTLPGGAGGTNHVLPAGAECFWTEHSERSTLPSWAGTQEFPENWLDLLGRWGARRSAGYVRTHRLRVMIIQNKIVEGIRNASDPSTMLGEEQIGAKLKEFLMNKGSCELTAARAAALIQTDCAGDSPRSDSTVGAAYEHLFGLTDEEFEDITKGIVVEPEYHQEAQSRLTVHEVAEVPQVGWCISTRSSGIRCLHKAGGCWRRPGRDYTNFEHCTSKPTADMFEVSCKDCFKGSQVFSSASDSSSGSSITRTPISA